MIFVSSTAVYLLQEFQIRKGGSVKIQQTLKLPFLLLPGRCFNICRVFYARL